MTAAPLNGASVARRSPRSISTSTAQPPLPRRFALLWSNIETLKPAVYAKLPQAVVSRRFKDSDPAGRKASEILERAINTTFDLYGFDEVMRGVRDDRLLVSRGTAWIRYEAELEDTPQKDEKGEPVQAVASEKVCHDFVHWTDFGHTLDRTWKEVTLVWRRVYMTKPKATKRFGKEKADKLSYEVRPQLTGRTTGDGKDATQPQAIIYEIWDRDEKATVWLAKEEKVTLDNGKPPLDLRMFFPCPEPVYGTKSTGTLIPTPDYRYYQDQAEEIDDLTQKIASLSEWLILKAFIPSGPSSEGADAIVKMLQELTSKVQSKGIFVPVESWAGFTDKGGSRMIDWLPIDMVINTIQAAITCRQQLINDVYQITGISDILRGETDPNETLGAQQLKAQTGGRRISTIQGDIARFSRDLAEMTGEVIAEVFQVKTIEEMTGSSLQGAEMPDEQVAMMEQQVAQGSQMAQPGQPPDPRLQQMQAQLDEIKQNKQVLQILRDEKTRGCRIEIETDSTIEPDETAEKQSRVEFVTAIGAYMEKSLPIVQASPAMAPAIGEILLFLVRGYRAGRQVEDVIERAMQQVAQTAQQPHESPEMQAEQAKAAAMQHKAELDEQAAQANHARDLEKIQQEMARDAQAAQIERDAVAAEQLRLDAEHRRKMEELAAQERLANQKDSLEAEAAERDHSIKLEQMRAGEESNQRKIAAEDERQAAKDADQKGVMRPSELKPLIETVADLVTELKRPKRRTIVRDPAGKVLHADEVPIETMN
jgi:hypothetical protein